MHVSIPCLIDFAAINNRKFFAGKIAMEDDEDTGPRLKGVLGWSKTTRSKGVSQHPTRWSNYLFVLFVLFCFNNNLN